LTLPDFALLCPPIEQKYWQSFAVCGWYIIYESTHTMRKITSLRLVPRPAARKSLGTRLLDTQELRAERKVSRGSQSQRRQVWS